MSKSASTESRLSRSVSGEFTNTKGSTSSVSSESQLSLSRDDLASSLERPYDAEGPEINEVRACVRVCVCACVCAYLFGVCLQCVICVIN